MNKKATTFTFKILISLIVLLMSAAILFLLQYKTFNIADFEHADVQRCSQSALLTSVARVPIVGTEFFKYVCPVTHTTLKYNQVSSLAYTDKKEFAAYGYTDTKKDIVGYNVDKFMWNRVRNCFAKVNDGRGTLFEKDGFDVKKFLLEPQSTKVFCVVCSTIDFDPKISTELPLVNARKYFTNEKLVGTDQTLSEHILSQAHPKVFTDPTSFTVGGFTPKDRYAVVYYRSNFKWYQEWISQPIANGVLHIGAFLMAGDGGDIEKYLDDIRTYDYKNNQNAQVQGVTLIKYDPAKPLHSDDFPNCDVLANSFEDK